MEPCIKAVAQKMLENHINSHQKRELRKALKKHKRALLRPKRPNDSRSSYNKRIKNTQQRIGILSKLLGIAEPKPMVASSNGINPDAVKLDAVDRDVVNPDAVNLDAVNPDALKSVDVNPDAVHQDAINPEPINPDAAHPTLMH